MSFSGRSSVMNSDFDELQKFNRYKIGYKTMFLALIIIAVNGFVKGMFNIKWAEPTLESEILVMIIAGIFAISCIIKDAYSAGGKNSNRMMLLFAIIGFMNIFSIIYHSIKGSKVAIIENGMLGSDCISMVASIFFIVVPSVYGIKLFVDKRRFKDEK
jgi:hypothetical protein